MFGGLPAISLAGAGMEMEWTAASNQWRVLGDSFTRDGMLQEALEVKRAETAAQLQDPQKLQVSGEQQ